VNGNVTLHQRYIYRGYLQIACIDLTRAAHPALWYITWDPTQPVATRPLAIQLNGTWYTYGWDLTKNICEVYRTSGTLGTSYTYTPYGQVSAEGATEQPIQWSSEFNDTELGLTYYNYRHYNPVDGRWMGRDKIDKIGYNNLYIQCGNNCIMHMDCYGNQYMKSNGIPKLTIQSGRNEEATIVATVLSFHLEKGQQPKSGIIERSAMHGKFDIIYPKYQYEPQIIFYRGNSRGAISIDDEVEGSRYNTYRKHEMVHVEIATRNWNYFVAEVNLLTKGFCSREEAELARELAQQIYIIFYNIAVLENNLFDYREYGYDAKNTRNEKIKDNIQSAESNIASAKSEIEKNKFAEKYGYDYKNFAYVILRL
jgi:RHS repeat-associated protein